MIELPKAPFLYAITDRNLSQTESITEIVTELCKGGVSIIQIREKNLTTRDYTDLAMEAVSAARKFDAKIIINDRADVAKFSGAAGVHLGDEEIPVHEARGILGDEAIIGYSCHTIDDVQKADEWPLNYLAIGPVYPTTTKELKFKIVGLDLVSKARKLTEKPLVAIGGIDLEKGKNVISAGADSVAVIGAIMKKGRIRSSTEDFIRNLL